MSDRLRELLRQRALLQEHLAWLDREIAGASDSTAASSPRPLQSAPVPLPAAVPLPALPPAPAAPVPATPPPDVTPVAEQILRDYRVEPRSLQQDVRKGCFLYFIAAFVLLGLGVTVLYFAIGSR